MPSLKRLDRCAERGVPMAALRNQTRSVCMDLQFFRTIEWDS